MSRFILVSVTVYVCVFVVISQTVFVGFYSSGSVTDDILLLLLLICCSVFVDRYFVIIVTLSIAVVCFFSVF